MPSSTQLKLGSWYILGGDEMHTKAELIKLGLGLRLSSAIWDLSLGLNWALKTFPGGGLSRSGNIAQLRWGLSLATSCVWAVPYSGETLLWGQNNIVTTPTQPQLNLFWVWHDYSNEFTRLREGLKRNSEISTTISNWENKYLTMVIAPFCHAKKSILEIEPYDKKMRKIFALEFHRFLWT